MENEYSAKELLNLGQLLIDNESPAHFRHHVAGQISALLRDLEKQVEDLRTMRMSLCEKELRSLRARHRENKLEER